MSPLLTLIVLIAPQPADVHVRNGEEFRKAVEKAKPGDRILLEPGDYPGGFHFKNVNGNRDKKIFIEAADFYHPPRFVGGGNAIQLSDCNFLELKDLVATGQTGNGFNIDDGGTPETPSRNIVLRNLKVSDLPKGNFDGIKLSGIEDFYVINCVIEKWGGSAVDMVGCHKGFIEISTFRNGGDSGVQCKGGSSDIVIQQNVFENYGGRGVNVGGSTGMPYFRPPVTQMAKDSKYEAKNITIQGNIFSGGTAPIAFVGMDGATVRLNTIYDPERWAIRILQETQEPGFVPCRNGAFEDNLVVFRSDRWFSGGVNVGGGTSPETFKFARNFWYCLDRPERSKPTLPTTEIGQIVGKDPLLKDPAKGDYTVKTGSPASKVGAHVFIYGPAKPASRGIGR